MRPREVFISKTLADDARARVLRDLRSLVPDAQIVAERGPSSLTIADRSEVTNPAGSGGFCITPSCLRELVSCRLSPFDLKSTGGLVSLFLRDKSVSVEHVKDPERTRLASMVTQMAGHVRSHGRVDYVVSQAPVDAPGAAVVRPEWLDALFNSDRFVSADQFRVDSLPFTLSQRKKQITRVSETRLELKVESQTKQHKGLSLLDKVNSLIESPARSQKVAAPKGQLQLQVSAAEKPAEAPPKRKRNLDELCTALFQTKPRLTRLVVEPASEEQDALMKRLNQFSQREESQKAPSGFDIDYEREGVYDVESSGDEADPLFNVKFSQCSQLSQL